MNTEEQKQIDLLAVFHFVVGGITALMACMPFMHVFVGLMMMSGDFFGEEGGAPPPGFGLIFVVMGSFCIIAGWAIAIGIVSAGFKLKARRNRLYCMVVAGIECMFMPFGTVLGVFTLILLNRDSVRAVFDGPPPLNDGSEG